LIERPSLRRRGAVAGWALAGLAATVLAACDLPPGALDAPYPVNLHIDPTATVVGVYAPGWYADSTGIFLCPTEPPPMPDPGDARIGWIPGRFCHDYGTHASPGGITIDLPLADLTGAERAAFAASTDWYLVMTDLDGERVTAATRSRFSRPKGFGDS
jgi:hypothetical protein